MYTKGLGARQRRDETPAQREEREKKLAEAVKTILTCIGEDPEREGLVKTPDRYAKALMFFTQGYERNIHGKSLGISGDWLEQASLTLCIDG